MIRACIAVFAALLVAGAARADDPLIDYQGYSFETGAFPPSAQGDVLTVVGVVDALDGRFNLDLGTTELTVVASDLVSGGEVDLGNGYFMVSYAGGLLNLFDDPTRDHDYGTSPPNASAPATFTNGTLFLGGAFNSFFLYFNPTTGDGAYEGYVLFTAGTGLTTLNQINSKGYTFGGVLSRNAVPNTAIPNGYDLQVDGILQVGPPIIGVMPMTWSAVKEMYGR
jgi:hypothetical protein